MFPIPPSPGLPQRWQITMPDRADDLQVFPYLPGRAFPVGKSILWSTKIATSVSGRERRAQYWSAPKWLFKFTHEFLSTADPASDEWRQLVEFILDHAGQARPFYLFDPSDNVVSNQAIGLGDGVTVAFQLTRSVRRWSEPVYVVTGGPRFYVNSVEVSAKVVDNGIALFDVPPAVGAVVTWSGMFMFLCRFDQDQFDFSQDFSDVWSLADLSFRSIKPGAPFFLVPSLNYALPSNSAKWLFLNAF